jgi:urease accessory protein
MAGPSPMATTTTDPALPLLRLMHLVSPSLPVGGFSYSQGIEWAVEAGWIRTAADLEDWLRDQLQHGLAGLDLPLLVRMHAAARAADPAAMASWIDWLIAGRETAELRAEEANRGRAMVELLVAWGLLGDAAWRPVLPRSQAAGLAFAAAAWGIGPRDAALGYAWGWMENLTLAGVKLVPLGQTQGQRMLHRVIEQVPAALTLALSLTDEDIGASSPALAIASSLHETQYTRLFRS